MTPRTEELLDAVPALAVLAGLRLDLFSHLADTPRTAAEAASRIGGDERRLQALLHALAALDLLEVRPAAGGGPPRFLCRPAAARRLAAGGEDYAGHGRELAARLWAAGLTVADSIRRGAATAPEAAGGDSDEETGAFLRALHPGALRTGREIARRGWLDGCRRIVDAGGGSGGLAAALQRALPEAEVRVVERESAAPWTRRLLEEEGATGVRVVEGDLAAGGSSLEGGLDLPLRRRRLPLLPAGPGPGGCGPGDRPHRRLAAPRRPPGDRRHGGTRRRPALAARLGGAQHPPRRPLRRRPRLHTSRSTAAGSRPPASPPSSGTS